MNLDENGIVVSLTRLLNLVFKFTASFEWLDCLLINATPPVFCDHELISKHALYRLWVKCGLGMITLENKCKNCGE